MRYNICRETNKGETMTLLLIVLLSGSGMVHHQQQRIIKRQSRCVKFVEKAIYSNFKNCMIVEKYKDKTI